MPPLRDRTDTGLAHELVRRAALAIADDVMAAQEPLPQRFTPDPGMASLAVTLADGRRALITVRVTS